MSKVNLDLDNAIHFTFYELKKVKGLYDSVCDHYFGLDSENVHMCCEEAYRQFYDEVQSSLQGIDELLNNAISSAMEAVSIFDQEE